MTTQQHHRITATRPGDHWKDRAAGWNHYRIDGTCQSCGTPTTDRIYGTREQSQDLVDQGLIRCRRCLQEGR